ncbi:hypothetical protein M0R45_001907 [Rubus argutus]|uniref:Uncharacterized protein n=1 Tax=Rubus argutus TaxID=59490 RepID=A0AAW1VJ42_RUBAR
MTSTITARALRVTAQRGFRSENRRRKIFGAVDVVEDRGGCGGCGSRGGDALTSLFEFFFVFNFEFDLVQAVRGNMTLPHGSGKVVRVAFFAEGADADEARAAGADIDGGVDLVEEIASKNQPLLLLIYCHVY